jgi:CheY-like chemotaxis protein
MTHKLNTILLVDDSDSINFIHSRIIKKAKCTQNCIAVTGGQKALDFLQSKENEQYPKPNLILLDINMPGMDGWEFAEYHSKLPSNQQADVVVLMLTTSLNKDDELKVEQLGYIDGVCVKPLTIEILTELIERYFPNN